MEKLMEQFLLERRTELSEASREAYRYKLQHFFSVMQERSGKSLGSLTKKVIVEYVSLLMNQGKKTATISNFIGILKAFAKWLYEADHLTDKEYKKIQSYRPKLLKGEDNRRALTPEEENLCLQELTNPIHQMLFFVGVSYGLRTQEHENLRVSDVDLERNRLTIYGSKGNKTRYIPILPVHVKRWQNWLSVRESYSLDHDYIFFTSRGKCSDRWIQGEFRKMSQIVFGDKQEKWFTPHTLRYTYATKLWRGGMDLYLVSKMLGHENLKTTMSYLKVRDKELMKRYLSEAATILH